MNNYVFIIDANRNPLKPCSPKRAKQLQKSGRAKAIRRYPFTLILDKEVTPAITSLELRIDPGSKYTGFALVNYNNEVIWAMELEHRGQQISQSLTKRAGFRRNRRNRKTRYRQARFNRQKPNGWLAPSVRHRVETVQTWIERICRYSPVQTIVIEKVKFDTQKLDKPDIQGAEYQQGTLAGYTIREALLEHWGRECAYCQKKDVPLQIEHIKPKSFGGSNRFNNLTLACPECNQAKGNRSIKDFLANKPQILDLIESKCNESLADAAAVNSTRQKIFEAAQSTGKTVLKSNGALAKLIRAKSGLAKAHWIDAACNCLSLKAVKLLTHQPLLVAAIGHGNRQARRCNKSGFPAITSIKKDPQTGKKIVNYILPKKVYRHVTTGDIVNVTIDKNRKHILRGTYTARVKTPTAKGVEVKIAGHRVSSNIFKFIHRNDGYDYSFSPVMSV